MFGDQVVVVSGGSNGIGLASCARFAALGARAVYNLDVAPPSAKTERVKFENCDVSKASQVQAAIQHILKTEKRIDVLFANAGIFYLGDIEETGDDVLTKVVETNIKGIWNVIRACIPSMREKKKGAIVITGSDQSLVGRKKSAAYGLTKAAVAQLAKSLALDYAQYGIRVNCVCPGAIDTPLCRQSISDWAKKYGGSAEALLKQEAALQPLGRIGHPDDVAKLVTFLASTDACNITGSLFSTDGGYVAQ